MFLTGHFAPCGFIRTLKCLSLPNFSSVFGANRHHQSLTRCVLQFGKWHPAIRCAILAYHVGARSVINTGLCCTAAQLLRKFFARTWAMHDLFSDTGPAVFESSQVVMVTVNDEIGFKDGMFFSPNISEVVGFGVPRLLNQSDHSCMLGSNCSVQFDFVQPNRNRGHPDFAWVPYVPDCP